MASGHSHPPTSFQQYQPLSHALGPVYHTPYVANPYMPMRTPAHPHHVTPAPASDPPPPPQQQEPQEQQPPTPEQPPEQPPQPSPEASTSAPAEPPAPAAADVVETPLKRKRGRPKGSKTKRRHTDGGFLPLPQNHTSQPARPLPPNALPLPPNALHPPPVAVVTTTDAVTTSTPNAIPPTHPTQGPIPVSAPAPMSAPVSASAPAPPLESKGEEISIKNYYEFQWRALSLCAEFYEAAGDLVRATPASVLAQALHGGTRTDPLQMLNDAKQACDILLADPSRLSSAAADTEETTEIVPSSRPHSTRAVPPSSIPPLPSAAPPSGVAGSSSGSNASATSQPQTPQAYYPQQPVQQPQPQPQLQPVQQTYRYAQPYQPQPVQQLVPQPQPPLQLLYTEASTEQSTQQAQQAQQNVSQQQQAPHAAQPETPQPQRSAYSTLRPIPAVTHGAWKEEELEKLKRLAEESRGRSQSGEIDWEWTAQQFGETRSKHQILIKATNLGLKPTSTHPSRQKRRLNTDASANGMNVGSASPRPPSASTTAVTVAPPQQAQQAQQPVASSSQTMVSSQQTMTASQQSEPSDNQHHDLSGTPTTQAQTQAAPAQPPPNHHAAPPVVRQLQRPMYNPYAASQMVHSAPVNPNPNPGNVPPDANKGKERERQPSYAAVNQNGAAAYANPYDIAMRGHHGYAPG
ncbi:hypothetical protein BOTBODRAFT_33576 [Botryobasidium botryosum FD-172 SS1]|uniref:Myb-like domain-containing protein n=1 Tax=Botryobasidium botryosum (strain FD-172 SS1) TaxID=930990 RepID=A0A067MNV0_BOTB1|nr:hypothetical protein BOTBODRAFT_33576 [Botryobasidium botryosum FD-172 SS1]